MEAGDRMPGGGRRQKFTPDGRGRSSQAKEGRGVGEVVSSLLPRMTAQGPGPEGVCVRAALGGMEKN